MPQDCQPAETRTGAIDICSVQILDAATARRNLIMRRFKAPDSRADRTGGRGLDAATS
jgi:hypothetical protein